MAREQRLVFGEDAELFDRVRPSYPARLVDDVVGLVGLPCRAVDAGCGTGRAAVLLAERGVEGVGVEPHPAMAEVARRNLRAYPGWRVDVAGFEEWSPHPHDGPFDLVACAQAWHWIDREQGARNAQRLLRPGGWLTIWENRPVFQETPLRRAIDAAYEKAQMPPSAIDQAPTERVPPASAFGSPLEREYPGSQVYTTAGWIELLSTSSDHKMLPADRRERLLKAVAAAIDEHGGRYEHHFVYRLWAVQRR
jgi:SAM-dependent methyltransferase